MDTHNNQDSKKTIIWTPKMIMNNVQWPQIPASHSNNIKQNKW